MLPDPTFDRPDWIEVAGGQLPYWHAGSGTALLFIHGWTLDGHIWAPQMVDMARSHHVISFDRRGFGKATAPPDVSEERADILALLDHIGVEKTVLVAMSQGARSALAVTARHPERVQGLVLVGAPYPCALPSTMTAEDVPMAEMADCASGGDWQNLRRIWKGCSLLDMPGASAEAVALLNSMVDQYRGRDLLGTHGPVEMSEAELATIAIPTLVLTGAKDSPFRRTAADMIHSILRDSRRAEIANAGHLCSLSHAAEFNGMLDEFVATLA